MITRSIKEQQVQALTTSLAKAQAGFLVDFQGLDAQQVTEMRKDLRNEGLADMKVCRNTLISRALEAYPEIREHFKASLTGSNAVVFAFNEPSRVAKILQDYVSRTEILKIKTGMLDGKGISLKDIKALASLPSMDVLRAQFLSTLSAPLSKLLSVFLAVPQGTVRVLQEYTDKNKDS